MNFGGSASVNSVKSLHEMVSDNANVCAGFRRRAKKQTNNIHMKPRKKLIQLICTRFHIFFCSRSAPAPNIIHGRESGVRKKSNNATTTITPEIPRLNDLHRTCNATAS